jgi:hypothetical protein
MAKLTALEVSNAKVLEKPFKLPDGHGKSTRKVLVFSNICRGAHGCFLP